MKNIFLLISFSLLFLFGARNSNDTPQVEERIGVENILHAAEGVLSCVSDLPDDDSEAYVDTESLARQYRVCGRGQRLFLGKQLSFTKNSAQRAVKKHIEMLFQTINGVYTSMPIQSWSVSSEYYVFGMRQILI